MNILSKSVDSLTFSDIEDFCKLGYPEGIQLDYKQELPKSLSKSIVAFTNTRGGLLIIGVTENEKSGTPEKWSGVKNEGKLIERANQFVANITPLPSCEIAVTNENNGKVFLLIRVFEGDKTPYYVNNDSNVWVRTGNIRNPIAISSPDHLEVLFKKREKAEKQRQINLSRANDVFEAALSRAEKERLGAIAKSKREGKESTCTQEKLGTQVSMLKIVLQPFYPKQELFTPSELKNDNNDIRLNNFPDLNLRPIPNGVYKFHWNQSGFIYSEQLYSNGLIYFNKDILTTEQSKNKAVYLITLMTKVIQLLIYASKFYSKAGYQGVLTGFISLDNMRQVDVKPIVPSGYISHYYDDYSSLLPEYLWELEVDTSLLGSDERLRDFCYQKAQEICWSFGFENLGEDLFNDFLSQDSTLKVIARPKVKDESPDS